MYDQYETLLKHVYEHGVKKTDRTGTGTISVFGYQMRFPLSEGFPLVTTKKLHTRSIIHELLWFLNGDTNIQYLHDNKVTIWMSGRIRTAISVLFTALSGVPWRTANGDKIDQISEVIDQIRHHPDSRRMIVCAWNVGDIPHMALPPLPLSFPVLCGGRQAFLPALPAILRSVPRRAL